MGFEDLGGAAVADTPPAPPMRLSDVARQNTFEHHVASRAHHAAGPASAPAPAPMGMAVPVGATRRLPQASQPCMRPSASSASPTLPMIVIKTTKC